LTSRPTVSEEGETLRKVVLFGTTDFSRIASVYLTEDSEYEVVAFTVNEEYLQEEQMLGRPVVPFERMEELYPPSDHAMFVAIGFKGVNRARAEVYDQCKARGYELISYVNSKAVHWGPVEMGENCFIFESNVIQPFVTLGNDVILWSGNHIGHDTTIGDHVFVASHAVVSGNVTIGSYCFVGVNATFRDGVTVAPHSVIGAGAVVMRDTEEGSVLAVSGTDPIAKKSWELRSL
jgi:sugar O-acyltransferase (sialic acid O-acetyltransferase NeuD family)